MKRCRFLALLAAAIFLNLLAVWTASAQTYRAQIRGLVTDQSGAVLPGATVTLSNKSTGVTTTKQSDSAGLYVFDYVDPGTYTVTVEAPGFGKFVQENVVVQSGGDVTVNATMNPGTLQQSVTVSGEPPAVEFNSTNQELTIDTKMSNDTPRLDRNPFKLTLLEPAAINTRGEMQPYNSWAPNSVDLGGGTNLKNNLLVDGSPIGLGHKAGYPPNQDDIQETIVSQNSVEAESGHSAGGLISLTTKSGTNEWHGQAFYLGRYPWLSAEADRTRFSENAQRQNMFGGTLGNPIIHNKLFNFFSLEDWRVGSPNSYVVTVPTALERQGDFSQSYNIHGGLRTIYDPYSTVINADGSVTRTAFPGNKVPASRFDPLSAKFMAAFWDPNNPGDNITGVNNFKHGYVDRYNYYNFSDRVDYYLSDTWRISGHYGRYYTTDVPGNPTPNNSELYQPAGSVRSADQVSADAIWTMSPATVVNFHGSWNDLTDAYRSKDLGGNGWAQFWPNNNFYQSYQQASKGVPVYFPNLNIGGNSFGGPNFFWNQVPSGESFSVNLSHQKGSHYFKAGFEYRRSGGPTLVTGLSSFHFNSSLTANTYNNPDTSRYGDQFATFLLGALDDSSEMIGGPSPNPVDDFFGVYFGDDWKITRNLTLTYGLRDEYETAWHDPSHNLSQGLNLSLIDPTIAANPPTMPSQVTSIVGNNYTSYNGMWAYTSASHPGMWHPQNFALQPRFGLAYRLNDKTAIRFGYALYYTPTEYLFTSAPVSGFEDIEFLEPPLFGVTGYQYAAPLQNGIPQESLSNPFPASSPLAPIAGRAAGSNTGRGGSPLIWYPANMQKEYNHRLNLTIEHQLPGQIVASVTLFANYGDQQYNQALNNLNPLVHMQYQSGLNAKVANPFYHYLNTTIIPGPLYSQQTVPLSSLLVKYPLYGPLYQIGVLGAGEQYKDVEVKIQKRFSHGYNFLFGYIYIREKTQGFWNDLETYQNQLVWQDSNQPHHRVTAAFTYELPLGKGKTYLASLPTVADAIIGGWQITGLITYTSGDYPRFGQALNVSGNPCVSNPTMQQWFNKSVFSLPSGYAIQTNPVQYSCLTGPSFFDLDASLLKNFHITERVQAQLKMTAYNATNKLNLGDPDTNFSDADFGQALFQGSPGGQFGAQTAVYGNQSGRQVELGFKLIF
ncbi:MAG TPA: carboxypeptidase-like regulatory domain-containing protein [Bryobacteraceae bacterium]|nr:carboxypeptidase-like regulatory domain-containing protein [Bryobacteraceae bacterium]